MGVACVERLLRNATDKAIDSTYGPHTVHATNKAELLKSDVNEMNAKYRRTGRPFCQKRLLNTSWTIDYPNIILIRLLVKSKSDSAPLQTKIEKIWNRFKTVMFDKVAVDCTLSDTWWFALSQKN